MPITVRHVRRGGLFDRRLAQRLDRCDVRSSSRRGVGGEHGVDRADRDTGGDGGGRDGEGDVEAGAECAETLQEHPAESDTDERTDRGCDCSDEERFDDDAAGHLLGGRTDRAEQCHLAAPLGDGDREGVVDHERTHDERDRCEDLERHIDDGRDLSDRVLELADEFVAGDRLEAARPTRAQCGVDGRGEFGLAESVVGLDEIWSTSVEPNTCAAPSRLNATVWPLKASPSPFGPTTPTTVNSWSAATAGRAPGRRARSRRRRRCSRRARSRRRPRVLRRRRSRTG
jgi:hypothetical protein